MSLRKYEVSVDAVALAAATAKSIFELATSANNQAKIRSWWVEFDGVTASNTPVKVEVGRFSAAVTTATAVTPSKLDGAGVASLSTAKHSTSTEGAGTFDAGETHRIPPTSGMYVQYPDGDELVVGVSGFFRIRCTAAQAVNATFGCAWYE